MKKLLLILICLFVSFEVKSKEIVFECQDVTEPKPSSVKNYFPRLFVFNRKTGWLNTNGYKETLINYKNQGIEILDFGYLETNLKTKFSYTTFFKYKISDNIITVLSEFNMYTGTLTRRTEGGEIDRGDIYFSCKEIEKKF